MNRRRGLNDKLRFIIITKLLMLGINIIIYLLDPCSKSVMLDIKTTVPNDFSNPYQYSMHPQDYTL